MEIESSKLSTRRSRNLVNKLLEIEKIREHQAVALVDLMPETKDEVRLIFAKERTSLTDKLIEQILSTIDEYRK